MSYIFGDSFDLYALPADAVAGYWDSGISSPPNYTLPAGRFTGGRCLKISGNMVPVLLKNSGQNDAVHHINFAYFQIGSQAGVASGPYFQFSDGATIQCTVVIRQDGALLLQQGTLGGTQLAITPVLITASNVWFSFEIEVIINNTTGRFRVRKNGNTVDDFDSGATLNTRPGANNYANRVTINTNTDLQPEFDDFLWRSDASSVSWIGDVRCYARMPVSDASVQFARAPNSSVITTPGGSSVSVTNGQVRYTTFTAAYDGTISTITVSMQTASTSNMKCSIFASASNQPAAVLGSATIVVNPTGIVTITFGTPVAVVRGTQYWIGVANDATSGAFTSTAGTTGWISFTSYASFPAASPGGSAQLAPVFNVTIGPTINAQFVNEPQQDGTISYVYDSTVSHADFYGLGTLGATPPSSIIALTTRGFMEKSDAGARGGAMQLKSSATTVAAPTLTLATGFLWNWRTDTLNPNGSVAWTTATADAAQIGPLVVS